MNYCLLASQDTRLCYHNWKKFAVKDIKDMHFISEWSAYSDSNEKYWFVLFVLSLFLWSNNKSQTTIDNKISSLATSCSRQDLISYCSSHPWTIHFALDYTSVEFLAECLRQGMESLRESKYSQVLIQTKLHSGFLRPLRMIQRLYCCRD